MNKPIQAAGRSKPTLLPSGGKIVLFRAILYKIRLKSLRQRTIHATIVHMLTPRQKTKIIKETGIHDKDSGSPEVQVALLTKRIDELTGHLRKHRKDNHSRRGLLGMVADRQTHLNYLKKNYPRRYSAIIKKLELKK